MAVSQLVIDSYKLLYSVAEMKSLLAQATRDLAAGVKMTSITTDGAGGSAQVIQGDPSEIVQTLMLAIQQLEGSATTGPPPLASTVNFAARRVET